MIVFIALNTCGLRELTACPPNEVVLDGSIGIELDFVFMAFD
jgi:hypothetical protein